jgi:hypothetical protein
VLALGSGRLRKAVVHEDTAASADPIQDRIKGFRMRSLGFVKTE